MAKDSDNKSLSEVNQSVNVPVKKGWFRTLVAFMGPAYLVSVGYMDPGNWATDIAGGSSFGYKLIWVLLMSNLMAILLQTLAARLGIVKGWDLAQASRQQYPRWVNNSLYFFAEIAIAACDLAEIIGMAIGLNLLFDLPLLYGVFITAFDTFILLFLINKGIRKLELFILSLVTIIGISFIVEMFIVKPQISEVMHGFLPSGLEGSALYIAIGIIGATVMPHNLYLHSALVQTRKIERSDAGIKRAIKFNFIDSAIALNAAFLVNAAILILAAAAFYKFGYNEISDIKDAHTLLSSLFGTMAPALFAIALISAGQSSTITGTLAGQIVMEGYLNLRISPWLRRLITRMIAIIPAIFTILYLGEEKLGELLILSQVVLSLQLGFAVIPLIHFTANKKLMGKFAIGIKTKILAWLTALIIVVLNAKLVFEEILSYNETLSAAGPLAQILVYGSIIYAFLLLMYITVTPHFKQISEKQIIPHTVVRTLNLATSHTFKRIAVTVDFSQFDEKAIQHAISIGFKDAEYFLIHIVESAVAKQFGKEVQDSETKKDLENVRSYHSCLALAGYRVNYELGYGNRSKEICRIIAQQNIDLVIMGAHGHAGLKDLIFGTTVDDVRHKAKIPIMVVNA